PYGGIPQYVFRKCCFAHQHAVTFILNASPLFGEVPSIWKDVLVTPNSKTEWHYEKRVHTIITTWSVNYNIHVWFDVRLGNRPQQWQVDCISYILTNQSVPQKWLESYLKERYMMVRVGNQYSGRHLCSGGVPQGGALSPLPFLIYRGQRKSL
ncbi:hypothetical protein COOONC_26699, partial [Cooperia oncophora]